MRRPAGLLNVLVAAGMLALVVGGCAPRSAPGGMSRAVPPRPLDPDPCACTLEVRYNLCVRVNGTDSLPVGIGLVREREGGERDSLDAGMRCFPEWRGVQRVLLLADGAVADSTGWFEAQTVDCCHAEGRTVEFTR